jgi:hypothetical protein
MGAIAHGCIARIAKPERRYCSADCPDITASVWAIRCTPAWQEALTIGDTSSCARFVLLGGTASRLDPFPERPPKVHRKRYQWMKNRAMLLEADLPSRHRGKTVDYRNLAYHAQCCVIR